MLVRIESIRGTSEYLVIDEIDRYLGYCSSEVFWYCTVLDADVVVIDDYEYYVMDKAALLKNLLQ